jgi:hypothetical protein
MAERVSISDPALPMMTVEEVNRVLEVGRILLAILTSEELDQLRQTMSNRVVDELNISSLFSEAELGNTGVT